MTGHHDDVSAASIAWYGSLEPFAEFAAITRAEHFAPVPDDWVVYLTDVVGSTRAIEAGRYKDVNTIGAATISTALQVVGGDVPYVFGGDGATVVVPPEADAAVGAALGGLAELARAGFDLGLRVGRVPVATIRGRGGELAVARHALAADRCIAVFRGGGLTLAEDLVKGDPGRWACAEPPATDLALTGLSCRWDRIPARGGCSLSLLVVARDADPAATYAAVLAVLDEIFEGRLDAANPVTLDRLRYRGLGRIVADERRYHARRASLAYAWRLVEIAIAVALFRSRLALVLPVFGPYARSMAAHADHRKFDDMLRMVVDCTPAQADRLEAWLAAAHARGRLCYGLHRATASLMTCYVEGLGPGGHIHFVDGADGGYALAAKGLKAQLGAAPGSREPTGIGRPPAGESTERGA